MKVFEQPGVVTVYLDGASVEVRDALDVLDPKPADLFRVLNLSSLVKFDFWNGSSRYARWQEHVSWRGATATVAFAGQSLANGGGARALEGSRYTLLLDGEAIAVAEVAAGATRGVFTVDTSSLPHGYHVLDIEQVGSQTPVPWPVYVDKGGPLPQWMPVATSSHEVAIGGHDFRIMWVPAKIDPTVVPLPARSFVPFGDAVNRSKLSLESLVVRHQRRPAVGAGGELTTMQRQWYTIADAVRSYPRMPLVDGPRGVAQYGYINHAMVGTARHSVDPSSPLRNNVYVCTPWSVVRVASDGTATTLVGQRHPGINSYWEDPSNVEVVGDFGDEPLFHEIWGAAWDVESLTVDTAAAPIPTEDDRQPHTVGPRLFVTNPQNNRVQACDFPARTHGPAKVSTWFKGADCWDVVGPCKRGHYYVSVRGEHRVVELDRFGTVVRDVLKGAALSKVDPFTRLVTRLAPLTTIQEQPIVGPEGLAIMDDWLYVASHAMGQVIRVNLETGERQVVVAADSDHNYFVKIAVSDGSFGPRHTLFITSWSVSTFGYPRAYLPDGTKWSLATYNSPVRPRGAGGNWDGWGYNGAVGVGNGRLVGGGSSAGVYELRLADSTPLDAAKCATGEREFYANGYWLTHGEGGYGHYGLPLPWGESDNIDYFLSCHGHSA